MIEQLDDFPAGVVAFACKGQVTKEDYETVLIPRIEAALQSRDKLRLYYQIGPEVTGIDPGAMWEDFKLGVGNFSRWERVAVVTDIDWIRTTMKVFGFLIPGEVRAFPISETDQACDWIVTT